MPQRRQHRMANVALHAQTVLGDDSSVVRRGVAVGPKTSGGSASWLAHRHAYSSADLVLFALVVQQVRRGFVLGMIDRKVAAAVAQEPRAPQHVEQRLPRALNLLALVVRLQLPPLSRRRRADRRRAHVLVGALVVL